MAHTGDPAQDALCAALIHDLDAARASPRVLHRRRRRVLAAWGRILAVPGTTVEDSDWAWAVVGLLDVPLRDLLISWLCPGTLELDAFPVALRRLALGVLPARSRGVTGADAADPVGATDSSDPYRGGDPADPSVGGDPTDSHLRGDPADRAEAADPAGGISGADGLAGLDAAESADLVERLATVCRRSPPELAPGPLTVLAHVAWWLGDGALARTALERALEVDPGYRLAALLERMVDGAVRPRRSA